MSIEQLFFEVLQVAIGNRKTLSVVPCKEQWTELFALSKKQALVAVAFAGVSRLKELDAKFTHWCQTSLCKNEDTTNSIRHTPYTINLQDMVYLKWLGLTAKVAQRNREVSAACVELVKQYAHDGLVCCLLKGQGNLEYYPDDMRECRTPGDIDIWVKPMDESGIDIAVSDLDGRGAHYEKHHGNRAVIEYVKMLWRLRNDNDDDNENYEIRYHHIDAPAVNGVEVEAHFRPLFLDSPLRNWRLQRWFRENEQFGLHDFAAGADKTKTHSTSSGQAHKTPDGCESACESEIVSNGSLRLCSGQAVGSPQRLPSSASQSFSGNFTAQSQPSVKNNKNISFPIPTVSFNAVYQLCHIYRHLFDEGIGLRQLLDYYFVLRALHIEQGSLADRTESMAQWAEGMGVAVKSNAEIMHTLSRFGMRKFASATMYVLQTVFEARLNPPEGGKLENTNWQTKYPWMICEPNEKEGKFLLNEIMLAGNFGKYDTRIKRPSKSPLKGDFLSPQIRHAIEKTKHNLRLLTHYPEEVLCEPFFRIYHFLWRKLELWRY